MKVDDDEKNEAVCQDYCGGCPSYPGTDEWLFCSRGKSSNEIVRKGCLCPACGVYAEYYLSRDYFCSEGAAE